MIVKKLILKGYKRFLLSNIDYLEYTPQQTIQMIVSRNLAGKSSLLRQLNPLPADIKKDFLEEGYKHIEIEHNNHMYTCVSKGNKHNFLLDNEELNPGGTKKVQLELVQEHFKITPAIMDIVYNTNKFTLMTPNERKYWLTQLSHIDYTFATNLYKNLKQRHRDIVGSIKLLKDEQAQTELNVLEKSVVEKLLLDKKHLQEYIDFVQTLYVHQDYDRKEYTPNLGKKLQQLIQEDVTTDSLAKLKENRIKLENDLVNLTNNMNKHIEMINKLENVVKVDQLPELIKKKEELVKVLGDTVFPVTDFDYIENESGMNKVILELTHFANDLTNVEVALEYNKEEILGKHKNVSDVYVNTNRKISLLKTEIEHIEKAHNEDNKIVCEKCNHTMYKGYDPNRLNTLKKEEVELLVNKDKIEKTLTILEDQVGKIKKLEDLHTDMKNCLRSIPSLVPYLKVLIDGVNVFKLTSSNWLTMLSKWKLNYDVELKNYKIVKEIAKLDKDINDLNRIKEMTKDLNKDQLSVLTKELNDMTVLKNKLGKDKEELNKQIIVKTDMVTCYYQLKEQLKDEGKLFKKDVVAERNKQLLEYISYLKSELIEIENKLYKSNKVIEDLKTIKNKIEEYSKVGETLEHMCTSLSPDKGLIAKSVNGFINVILEEMNKVIASIWTYGLEIQPCSIEEDELDYKFKVKVNNDHIVEDISKLSSSGLEIVELAFRIVFIKYMGLVDFPIYLDEFGSTFDKAHRNNAFDVLDKIMSSDFKQMYIICHYEELFSRMNNTDLIVLDPNNTDVNGNDDSEVMKIIRG